MTARPHGWNTTFDLDEPREKRRLEWCSACWLVSRSIPHRQQRWVLWEYYGSLHLRTLRP